MLNRHTFTDLLT